MCARSLLSCPPTNKRTKPVSNEHMSYSDQHIHIVVYLNRLAIYIYPEKPREAPIERLPNPKSE
jgi:hypothetical protein